MTPTLICPNVNQTTSGLAFNFKVASSQASMVLDVTQPQRVVYSDAALTLKGTVISCDVTDSRALKGKYFRVGSNDFHTKIYLR